MKPLPALNCSLTCI